MSVLERQICRLIKAVFILLGMVPRRWSRPAGNFLGRILFGLDRKHREIALDNLFQAFQHEKKPREIRQLVRRVFENLGQILFEIGWSLRLEEKDFHKHFRVTGMSNIINAYKKNKGVLVLTAHMGNWELLTIVAAMTGCPTNIVARPLDYYPLDHFFSHARSRFGANLIPTQKSMRMVLRGLAKRELVAMLMDQNVSWRVAAFVSFFGRPACTNRVMAVLALKTGAPVVPVFLSRRQEKFMAEFGPEIPLVKTGDVTSDIEVNTQRYNDVIEAFIRRYPEQWFWVHQRWKTKNCCPWPKI